MNRLLIVTFAALLSHFALACAASTTETSDEALSTSPAEARESTSATMEEQSEIYGKVDARLVGVNMNGEEAPLQKSDRIDLANISTRAPYGEGVDAKPKAPASLLNAIAAK